MPEKDASTKQSAEQSKKRISPKAIKITASVLVIGIVLVAAVGFLFGSELRAISSLTPIEGTDAYTMEYTGDYGLDAFMEQGAASDGEVVEFVSKHFLHGIPVNFELPDFGCSAFTARTPEGEHVTGRNFDFDDTPIMVVKTTPKNGYASISTVDLDFLGFNKTNMPDKAGLMDKTVLVASIYAPMDGINEKGLSVSVLQLPEGETHQRTGKPGLTTSTAIRVLLDKAASTSGAIALLKEFDMNSSANSEYHFYISDATGKSAVVEYIHGKMVVVDEDHVTNYLLAPGADDGKGSGYGRCMIVGQELADCKGIMDEQDAMKTLSMARLLDDSDGMTTQWSAVFNNSAKTATYCFKTDYRKSHTYSLETGDN